MSGWRQSWMTDEWLEWWMSLDHSGCSSNGLNPDAPPYEQCHGLHCPDCGKPTSGQGHINCPERTPKTQAVADRRLGLAAHAIDAVNREAEACEDL